MKTTLTLLIIIAMIGVNTGWSQSNSNPWPIGKTKASIETEAKSKKGANISYGISNEGFVFMMDEAHDGSTAWYFDDKLICIAYNLEFVSEQGKNSLVKLRIYMGQNAKKIENNLYFDDGLYFKFSNPTDRSTALLVYKKI